MSYYLWKAILGRTPKIEITKEEHDTIFASWRAISVVADIEEEWDCLVQNYIDLEMELLRSAMHSMVLNHESYHEFQQIRLGFSRRLSNLLQSCRSYLDHTPHHLNKLKSQAFADPFKKLTNTAHDGHFGYRFMEALRNYAQHRGLPLHGASFDARWMGNLDEGDDDKGLLRHVVLASINLAKIKGDKKFSAKLLAEVDGDLEHLDVATLTREYIEALGGVHDGLRKLLKGALAEWKSTVRDAIARYAEINGGNAIGLSVAEFNENGTVKNHINIFDDLLLRLERLTRRNGSLINLRRRYVTNELLPPKKSRTRKKAR
jgi:hypothetical protein